MIVNADLHIHSPFSASTSPKMSIYNVSLEAPKKGIDIVGTGDCLHDSWLEEIKKCNIVDEGTFELNGTRFILSTEVETKNRVHHLLYFNSVSAVEEFKKITKHFSRDLNKDGKPRININGEELASIAKEVEALLGPAHIFTPWTGVYSHYNSLYDCYGNNKNYISFVELGLSADTGYADRIEELNNLTFITNSDCHSPHPIRFGREFTRFEVKDRTFNEIKKGILRKDGNKPTLNVGLLPEEGKYNESACLSCHRHYSSEEALQRNWKCKCGNKIKKGVKDKIFERADFRESVHPDHRPPYFHLIPLYEIITKSLGLRSPFNVIADKRWGELIEAFGSEIEVLLDVDFDDISRVTVPAITESLNAFRRGNLVVRSGGGGKYGFIEIPWEENYFTISLYS